MEHDFWHDRWESNRIGFHEDQPNPLLTEHFPALSIQQGGRIFVPLCGKTLDIGWLMARGYQVAGAELSEVAIQQLFEELGVDPAIKDLGDLKRYSADGIDIFVGDIFNLTPALLGPVDAVFDRAALVALPAEMRAAYAPHIAEITGTAPQLLITFEYDQSRLDGPPFSVSETEVRQLYAYLYGISTMAHDNVAGGFKGVGVKEHVWLLKQL